jgi:enoyl-CoA hydratase/carnithine racemase
MSERFETLLYSVEQSIATITLNRPDRLNAFTDRMAHELIAAFDLTDADDTVRAVIVTGAGRGFCAGADLAKGNAVFQQSGGPPPDLREASDVHRDLGGCVTLRIFDSLKPVIAACNGPAVGVGGTMQLAMDIRLASAQARYGFVFARRGLVPEAASSWFLPRIVGISTALEWTFSGRVFGAEEALAKGLVRSVHEPDDLLPAARALASEIAEFTSPVSIALTRRMMWRMLGAEHPMAAHEADSRGIQLRGRSADAAEGIASFIEKRPASFPEQLSDGLPDIFPHWRKREFR